MSKNDLATQANVPVEFSVNGDSYKMQALTIADVGKLGRWAQEKYFADMKKRLDALPVESEASKKLSEEVASISVHDLNIKVRDYMESVDAGVFEKTLMLRHFQPEITKEKVEELIETQEFKAAYVLLMKVDESEKTGPPAKS